MPVYKLKSDVDVYDWLLYDGDDRVEFLSRFRGLPDPGLAGPYPATLYQVKKHGDFPHLAYHVPVFSERAWAAVGPLTAADAQPFTMEADSERYHGLNVLAVPDALDLPRSVATRTESGRVRTIKKYAFHPGTVDGKLVFKVPESVFVDVLVSEEFKDAVERHGLKGFIFEPAE